MQMAFVCERSSVRACDQCLEKRRASVGASLISLVHTAEGRPVMPKVTSISHCLASEKVETRRNTHSLFLDAGALLRNELQPLRQCELGNKLSKLYP